MGDFHDPMDTEQLCSITRQCEDLARWAAFLPPTTEHRPLRAQALQVHGGFSLRPVRCADTGKWVSLEGTEGRRQRLEMFCAFVVREVATGGCAALRLVLCPPGEGVSRRAQELVEDMLCGGGLALLGEGPPELLIESQMPPERLPMRVDLPESLSGVRVLHVHNTAPLTPEDERRMEPASAEDRAASGPKKAGKGKRGSAARGLTGMRTLTAMWGRKPKKVGYQWGERRMALNALEMDLCEALSLAGLEELHTNQALCVPRESFFYDALEQGERSSLERLSMPMRELDYGLEEPPPDSRRLRWHSARVLRTMLHSQVLAELRFLSLAYDLADAAIISMALLDVGRHLPCLREAEFHFDQWCSLPRERIVRLPESPVGGLPEPQGGGPRREAPVLRFVDSTAAQQALASRMRPVLPAREVPFDSGDMREVLGDEDTAQAAMELALVLPRDCTCVLVCMTGRDRKRELRLVPAGAGE